MDSRKRSCYECGSDLPYGATHCSNCGRIIRTRSEIIKDRIQRDERKLAEKELFIRSREAYDLHRKKIELNANKHRRIVFAFFSIFVTCAIATYFLKYNVLFIFIFIFLAISSLAFLEDKNRWLSSSEYYSLPGSRFQNGQHRCIFCGARTIYKKGEYATNNVYARCTKCDSELFKN